MNASNIQLADIKGKTIENIWQVDYNDNRHSDDYLPWLLFITFKSEDRFLTIEGDFDGDHIRLMTHPITEIEKHKMAQHFPGEPNLWQVYDTAEDETLHGLIGQTILSIEYGIDKNKFEINGHKMDGSKDLYRFICFHTGVLKISIFESLGLGITDGKPDLPFKETMDVHVIK